MGFVKCALSVTRISTEVWNGISSLKSNNVFCANYHYTRFKAEGSGHFGWTSRKQVIEVCRLLSYEAAPGTAKCIMGNIHADVFLCNWTLESCRLSVNSPRFAINLMGLVFLNSNPNRIYIELSHIILVNRQTLEIDIIFQLVDILRVLEFYNCLLSPSKS